MTPDLTLGGSGDLVLQVTNYLTRLNLLKEEGYLMQLFTLRLKSFNNRAV